MLAAQYQGHIEICRAIR